jgi:hypothetical protein
MTSTSKASNKSKTRFLLTSGVFLIFLWVFKLPIETLVGGMLCAFLFWQLLAKINHSLVFRELILIAFISQALLIPSYFYYYYEPILEGPQYEINIPDAYMLMATPACLIFFLVFYTIPRKFLETERLKRVAKQIDANKSPHQLLIFLGIFGLLGIRLLIPGLGFVFKIISELLIVGLLYFTFKQKNKLLIFTYLLIQFLFMVSSSMIGAFFISTFLFGIYFTHLFPISNFKKVLLIFFGASTLLLFQTIKHGYRFAKWYSQGDLAYASSFEVWKTLIMRQLESDDGVFNKDAIAGLLGRLNQGYLSGLTFDHVPENEPFANGETIGMAVASALVPRIFWPDKPTAGGQLMMKRYAGVTMINGTSMNIGLIGEAYVNFGIFGGLVFILIFTLLLRLLYVRLLLRIAIKKPHILLWFIPLVRPMIDIVGNDLLYTVNYLFKSFLVLIIIYYIIDSNFFGVIQKKDLNTSSDEGIIPEQY